MKPTQDARDSRAEATVAAGHQDWGTRSGAGIVHEPWPSFAALIVDAIHPKAS